VNKKVKEKLPATFEEALNLLEDSVSKLESGELTLEESLQVFERGIAASRACTGLLDQTRKRVQVLVEKEGALQVDFLQENDEFDEEEENGVD
jgi:exodeoxyribonuclease VII small subunit